MAHELTFEQIQKCKKVFDANKTLQTNEQDDSKIPLANLLKALQDLEFNNMNQKELNSIMEELGIETSNNEEIDFPVFLRIAGAKYKQQEFNESLTDAFKSFDDEGNGTLKYEELKKILTEFGPNLSEEEAKELLKDFLNENETFSYEDFISKNF